MKKLFSLLAATVLLVSMAGCNKAPEATPESTTTQPTTQKQTKTVFLHESVTHNVGGKISKTQYVYDSADRLTDVVVYDNDTESRRYLVTCDEVGNPIRWASAESATEYAYDALGHITCTKVYSGDILITTTEQVWVGGLRISVTANSPAQDFVNRTEYTYDDKSRLIRQDMYMGGQLSSYSICQTDDQGRLKRTDTYTPEGALTKSTIYAYDEKSERRTFLSAGGAITQTTLLTYDEFGNLLTSQTTNLQGELISGESHTWRAIEVPLDSTRASI